MNKCTVCGGEDFEKHAGYMYCTLCQTQSQDYFEQEYDYKDHDRNVIKSRKSQVRKRKRLEEQTLYEDDHFQGEIEKFANTDELKNSWLRTKYKNTGFWTSWEAFNFILYGMTMEIKKCGGNKEFEEMVFKLWAAYLRECQAAFVSKTQEKMPKLRLNFKRRDARILYNKDVPSYNLRKGKFKSKKCTSRTSDTSGTSKSSKSKKSLALQRGKVIAADYQDHLSVSSRSLADQTLDSLGESSDLETSKESLDDRKNDHKNEIRGFKDMLTEKDFMKYKNIYNSKELIRKVKRIDKSNIKFLGKNKLLSIIHLALLMTNSEIQLSDLLRFIRESHLSFAKVTHFFPKEFKFPKRDFSYVEVVSDILMPTHLRQRKITGQLACILKIERIPTPDFNLLVDRYCQDLNLPNQLADFSKRILENCFPLTIIPKSKSPLISCEAWTMVSIIFIMKLLFGLNDKTEIFLSHLAREINSARKTDQSCFVFEDWQKFIECRKTILTEFHYPTQEQLGEDDFRSSEKFLDTLVKESKDDYRSDRFIPYPAYYIEEKFLKGIKEMLNSLLKPKNFTSFDFQPSLTPQISHIKTIRQFLSEEIDDAEEQIRHQKLSKAFPEEILKQDFKACSLEFTLDPRNFLNLVGTNSDLFADFGIDRESDVNNSLKKGNGNSDILLDCPKNYWTFEYPDKKSSKLLSFKEEILERTPENFQWFIIECARMLEMNVRDIYDELLRLEKRFSLRM